MLSSSDDQLAWIHELEQTFQDYAAERGWERFAVEARLASGESYMLLAIRPGPPGFLRLEVTPDNVDQLIQGPLGFRGPVAHLVRADRIEGFRLLRERPDKRLGFSARS